jgi:hypothetical protein
MESRYGFTTFATQRSSALNKNTEGYGSIVYSLKSNGAITKLSDLKGKRIGVGSILAPGGFLLSWKVLGFLFLLCCALSFYFCCVFFMMPQLLDANGVNIYIDAEQVHSIFLATE